MLERACHPPLFELAEAGTWMFLDSINKREETLMLLITNAFFLAILLLSVYGIGSVAYSHNVGVLSAILVSFSPLIFGHTRVAMLDLPLASMVSFSFYLLLKTNRFQNFWYSLLAGIAFGLSQLTKETAIIFIAAPLVYYFCKSCSSPNKKRAVLNLALILLLFTIVAGSVYLKPENLHALQVYFRKITYIQNKPSVLYYLKRSILFPLPGPLIFIMSIPLFLSYLMNLQKRKKFFFLWLFVPLALFSISTTKTIRFLIPILPAFAIITTQELFNNRLFSKIKKKYVCILICFAVLQYATFNYGLLDKWYRFNYHNTYGLLSVQKDKYLPVSLKLLDVFKKERFANRRVHRVVLLFNIGEIDGPLVYKSLIHRLPIIIDSPMQKDKADSPRPGAVNWEDSILGAAYVVEKTGRHVGASGLRENIAAKVKEGFEKHKNNFQMIAEIKSFDDSYFRVYRKTTAIDSFVVD